MVITWEYRTEINDYTKPLFCFNRKRVKHNKYFRLKTGKELEMINILD